MTYVFVYYLWKSVCSMMLTHFGQVAVLYRTKNLCTERFISSSNINLTSRNLPNTDAHNYSIDLRIF